MLKIKASKIPSHRHSFHTIFLSVQMGEKNSQQSLSNSIIFPEEGRFGPHLLSFQFSRLKISITPMHSSKQRKRAVFAQESILKFVQSTNTFLKIFFF